MKSQSVIRSYNEVDYSVNINEYNSSFFAMYSSLGISWEFILFLFTYEPIVNQLYWLAVMTDA